MDLHKRGTVFKPPSIRGVTPDFHENELIEIDSHLVVSGYSLNKLKKRARIAKNNKPSLRIRG